MSFERRTYLSLLLLLLLIVLPLATSACGPGNGGGEPGEEPGGEPEPEPEPEQSWVRPNVGTLDPAGAELTTIRAGVEAMKARPASDPTSWLYQANMHGTYDTPALDAWNSCQHGSFFFLSWHRMYLYYFERILRDASGDPDLALPFWDYTDPAQRAIPAAFRDPAAPANPLFVAQRAPGINQGAQVPASATTFTTAMTFTNFSSATGSGLSFGGQRVPAPVHFGGVFGQIESQPHNIIHVVVGGQSGWMSDPNMAARDPIFYFHHANIDRLWNVWLARGDGRANPSEQNWRTQTFTFFDETGTAIQMTGEEVVDSAQQLHYTYAEGSGDQPQPEAIGTTESLPSAPFTDDRQEILVEKKVSARLAGKGADVAFSIPVAETEAIGDEDGRTTLVLEGIRFGRPGIYYEVYAGLPAGQTATPESPYYVGNVAIFGQLEDGSDAHAGHEAGAKSLSGGATLSYDITDLVARLRGREGFSGDMALHFEPRGLEMPEDQPGLEAIPAAREVRIETVKIVRE